MRYALIPLAVLGACTQTVQMPQEPKGPCVVDEALRRQFTGTKFRLDMRDEIQARANARVARVLRPDDAATMDYREDRLNILLDDDGRVNGFRCG